MKHGPTSASSKIAALAIYFVGDGFEVLWIDATASPAGVINLKPRANRPLEYLVRYAMCLLASCPVVCARISFGQRQEPQPAARIRLRDRA